MHSSSGEPAELTLRPRSFGTARTLASRTFEGLRAWLSIGSAPDGEGTRTLPNTTPRTTVPLRISRRVAGEGTVITEGESAEFGFSLPAGSAAAAREGSVVLGSVVSGGGGYGAAVAKAAHAACAAFSDVAVGSSVSGGKHAVHSWHGSSGGDQLLCSDEDTYDREEWALHFTCTQVRSPLISLDLP